MLGFLDLIESAFIRHFTAIGYSPQTIRKVARKLRDRHGVDHPFAMDKRFRADGRAIFEEVVADEGERRLVNLMNDNFEIVPVIEPTLFDQVFYVDDVAGEWNSILSIPAGDYESKDFIWATGGQRYLDPNGNSIPRLSK